MCFIIECVICCFWRSLQRLRRVYRRWCSCTHSSCANLWMNALPYPHSLLHLHGVRQQDARLPCVCVPAFLPTVEEWKSSLGSRTSTTLALWRRDSFGTVTAQTTSPQSSTTHTSRNTCQIARIIIRIFWFPSTFYHSKRTVDEFKITSSVRSDW